MSRETLPSDAELGALVSLDDAALAAALADGAGRRLLDVRAEPGLAGRELKDAGDAASQAWLAAGLAAARPGDAVLSEEAADSAARLSAARVWIIDPLDGTREFSEHRHDWAVHVALWVDGELALGAVALPGRGVTLTSAAPLPLPQRDEAAAVRIAVSRTRPPALVDAVVAAFSADGGPGAELVPMGSAGYKCSAVVLGEADAYVHAGGQYEWDSAAPVVVARASGVHTSRMDGSALRYNRPDPSLPDLVIARPELAEPILAACATVG
jgi:3'(2'), 5'-bisphosphate nucleotidase